MSCFLRIRDKGENFNSFQVPEPVYVYVRQLEAYIKDPKQSKLLEVYSNLRPLKLEKKKK